MLSIVKTVKKNYKGLTSAETKKADAAYKELGSLGNRTVEDFEKWYVPTISETVQLLLKT